MYRFPSNEPSNTQNQGLLCNLFSLGLSSPWVQSLSNDSSPMVVVLPLLQSLGLLRSLSSPNLPLQCKAESLLRSGYPCSCCCWFCSEELPLVPPEEQSREARAVGSSWEFNGPATGWFPFRAMGCLCAMLSPKKAPKQPSGVFISLKVPEKNGSFSFHLQPVFSKGLVRSLPLGQARVQKLIHFILPAPSLLRHKLLFAIRIGNKQENQCAGPITLLS